MVRELLSLDHTSATVPNDDGHTPLMIAADRACESPSEITELVLHMLERAGSTGTSSGVISPPRGCFGAATWAVAGGMATALPCVDLYSCTLRSTAGPLILMQQSLSMRFTSANDSAAVLHQIPTTLLRNQCALPIYGPDLCHTCLANSSAKARPSSQDLPNICCISVCGPCSV